jgi:hypothetical protein
MQLKTVNGNVDKPQLIKVSKSSPTSCSWMALVSRPINPSQPPARVEQGKF